MIMKINSEKLLTLLLENGMHPTRAKELVKQFNQDISFYPELYADERKRNWALEKGFLPGRSILYGPDFEKNYTNYYNDFDYFMSYPLNNHFNFWINDKLTLKYILNASPYNQYMPEYYLYVENDGRYSYLMDSPTDIAKDKNYILNLLISKKHLAFKPNHGSGGRGFFGLSYIDGQIYKDSEKISYDLFKQLISSINGYIVTEFIEQSSLLSDIYSKSDCTLRLVMFKKKQKTNEEEPEYDFMAGYARFGSSKSGGASNVCHGGLAIGINWETGCLERGLRGNYEFWGNEGIIGFDKHPDTNVNINNISIPNWNIIKAGLLSICKYMSSLDYFGMDVIITENGFKLCEINSAPSMGLGQFQQGKCALASDDAKEFAKSKIRPYKKTLLECFNEVFEED